MAVAAPPNTRYDDWYATKLANQDDHDLAPWHHQAIRFLPDLHPGLSVLDMGSGVGAFSRFLAQSGAQVVAADFSEVAIDHAREHILNGVPNASAVVADIMDIPFPDESFDVTIACSVLEHVTDPDKSLDELVRVTRRRGTLMIAMPNYLSLTGLYRATFRLRGKTFREIGQPINHPLMLPLWTRKVKKAGCKITAVDSKYFMLWVPTRKRHVLLNFLERPFFRPVSRWFGLHAFIRAVRL